MGGPALRKWGWVVALGVLGAGSTAVLVSSSGAPEAGAAALGASVGAIVVATRSDDVGRTGWNRNESVLSPSIVTPLTFHERAEIRLSGELEASPLHVAGVTTGAGPSRTAPSASST